MTNSTKPRPYVFVLMPFDAEFDDVYKLGIRPACENAGAYAERVDDQIFQDSILQRIYNQIAKADVIVADMTGRNPNVFYETGYAHALGKTVILLTKRAEDIPFDLKHYPHIVYGGRISDLIPQLEKRVKWAVENPSTDENTGSRLVIYHNRQQVLSGSIVEINGQPNRTGFQLEFDVHNADEASFKPISFEFALITPEKFIASTKDNSSKNPWYTVVKLPDGRNLHLPKDTRQLLPFAWEKISILVITQNEGINSGEEFPLVLRIHTDSTMQEIPFLARY